MPHRLIIAAILVASPWLSAAEGPTFSDLETVSRANRDIVERARDVIGSHRQYHEGRIGKPEDARRRMQEIMARLWEIRQQLPDRYPWSRRVSSVHGSPQALRGLEEEQEALEREAGELLRWTGREAQREATLHEALTTAIGRLREAKGRYYGVTILDDVKPFLAEADKIMSDPAVKPKGIGLADVEPQRPAPALPAAPAKQARLYVLKLADGTEITGRQLMLVDDEYKLINQQGSIHSVPKAKVAAKFEREE